jgi:ankyrin repeat protein
MKNYFFWRKTIKTPPLYEAINKRHLALARLLLQRGADPNKRICIDFAINPDDDSVRDWDKAPLHAAVINDDVEAIKVLLEYKANLARGDIYKTKPNVRNSDHPHDVEYEKLLSGSTPLHYAVENNSAKALKALLDHGANPYIMNNAGISPINIVLDGKRSRLWLCHKKCSSEIKLIMESYIQKRVQNRRRYDKKRIMILIRA